MALAFESKNRVDISSKSSLVISFFPYTSEYILPGLSSYTANLRLVLHPIAPKKDKASSVSDIFSVYALKLKILTISYREYGNVLIINSLSNKSTGIPWGDNRVVPLIKLLPLLVANITIGDNFYSNALFKKVKHSISNI